MTTRVRNSAPWRPSVPSPVITWTDRSNQAGDLTSVFYRIHRKTQSSRGADALGRERRGGLPAGGGSEDGHRARRSPGRPGSAERERGLSCWGDGRPESMTNPQSKVHVNYRRTCTKKVRNTLNHSETYFETRLTHLKWGMKKLPAKRENRTRGSHRCAHGVSQTPQHRTRER